MLRKWSALLAAAAVVACAERAPLPITPPSEVKYAPVARTPIEPAPVPGASAVPAPSAPLPTIAAPAGALYVCVADARGQQTQTAIEFAPKVADLCKRHPEMGPCQYERDLCRSSGGRVFAASGQEITRQIEDDYDRKVMRVRFRAN
jgi:hypothetical protein